MTNRMCSFPDLTEPLLLRRAGVRWHRSHTGDSRGRGPWPATLWFGYALDQEILVGGNYRGAVQRGNTVHVSGQLPRNGTVIMLPGRVGEAVTLAQAQQAARICKLRALHVLHRQLGSLDAIAQVLQMTIYTQSAADFSQQSEVADAASNMLQAVLGDAGIHTRTSVGVYQLPKNASVELNLTVAI